MSAGLVAARSGRITWITDVDPSGASVNIDRGQIEQVMINIVQNAVEAAGPDGTVAVRLRICERRSIVAVDDDGSRRKRCRISSRRSSAPSRTVRASD